LDSHLFCGISTLIAALVCYYKAREGEERGHPDAWTAAMMIGLSLTQFLPLLPSSFLPSELSVSLIGFAYGAAITAGVAAIIAKWQLGSTTASESLRDRQD